MSVLLTKIGVNDMNMINPALSGIVIAANPAKDKCISDYMESDPKYQRLKKEADEATAASRGKFADKNLLKKAREANRIFEDYKDSLRLEAVKKCKDA